MLTKTAIFLLFFIFAGTTSTLMSMETVSSNVPLNFEPLVAFYRRTLPPQDFIQHRAMLLTYIVSFLPKGTIGGMRSPYNYQSKIANEVLLTLLNEAYHVHIIVTLAQHPLPGDLQQHYPSITFYHKPIENTQPPSIQTLKEIVALVKDCSPEHTMVVHCIGGIERTGTVLAALLFFTTNYNMQEIIDYTRAGRKGAINPTQEIFLRLLESVIENKRDSSKTTRINNLKKLTPKEISSIEPHKISSATKSS